MNPSTIAAVILVTLVSAILVAFPGAADTGDGIVHRYDGPDCAPEVARALHSAAVTGVQRRAAIIRSGESGIRSPRRLADFACLDRFMDFGRLDVHASVDGLLDNILAAVTNRICSEAAQLHAELVRTPVPTALYGGLVLPPLDAGPSIDRALIR